MLAILADRLIWLADLTIEGISKIHKVFASFLAAALALAVVGGTIYIAFPVFWARAWEVAFHAWPFLLMLVLGYIFWHTWFLYKHADFISNSDHVVLEVKLHREILKTPRAMEIALGAFYQTPTITWWTHLTKGRPRPCFSLEIASIEGKVHFFIRGIRFYRQLIESNIYAQYPNAEIYEVEDYTKFGPTGTLGSHLNKKTDWQLWGIEYGLTKPDPYPIKTYVDYGLDKAAFEVPMSAEASRIKIADPITPIIEALGFLGKGEQYWMQIIVRATERRFPGGKRGFLGWFMPFDLFKQGWYKQDWKAEARKLVEEIRQKREEKESGILTTGEIELMGAIERNTGKFGYDCGIRGIYFAPRDRFKAINVVTSIGAMKQFSSQQFNGFRTANATAFDYPWEDFLSIRSSWRAHRAIVAFRARSFFEPPHMGSLPPHEFILSSEELATIYHFPGNIAETPTLSRIESTKSEPPINLPM